jgi:hypothetical protein
VRDARACSRAHPNIAAIEHEVEELERRDRMLVLTYCSLIRGR